MSKDKANKKCENCPWSDETCYGEGIPELVIHKNELRAQIIETLKKLYEKDQYLLNVKANEVCVSSRFEIWFIKMFQEEYDKFDIDVEYNRNGIEPKRYKQNTGENLYCAKPDMIIHKRGCNKYNIAIFEIKGSWNKDKSGEENDYKKLRAFTDPKVLFVCDEKAYSYKYRYGIHIKLFSSKVEIKWFINSEHVIKDDETLSAETWENI